MGLKIELNWKNRQIGKRLVTKEGIVPSTPGTHLQYVRNLKPPKPRDPCRGQSDPIEDGANRIGGFSRIDPGDRDG